MSDSEDDLPLTKRKESVVKREDPAKPSVANTNGSAPTQDDPESSDDDQPLSARMVKQPLSPAVASNSNREESKKRGRPVSYEEADSDADSDDEPLIKKKAATGKAKPKPKPKPKPAAPSKGVEKTSSKPNMWETLEHQGVLFAPPYEPHGIKLYYDGKPVDLSPEEEEVATFYAVMTGTDYLEKPVFVNNFWKDFVEILSSKHKKLIKELDKCDFSKIHEWAIAEREKKKLLTKEEKLKIKAEKDAVEAKYLWATIDGRREKVGNFRVEPPGLFRGRGEHPKMGKLKSRIMPEDVIINCGKDAQIPECPVPGHNWGEVRHDKTVTWLAGWKDSINTKDWKYVQFSAVSTIKGDSDMKKYEKARKLKYHIDKIRADYESLMESKDVVEAQMATAIYLIDKLALRAGGEKDEDLADTVGCCTLRVGHIELTPPNTVKFDFLGKDSIRYEQDHEVTPQVYEAFKRFCKGKKDNDDIFDKIDPATVNSHLLGLMDGLTIKVFRTYNASITLSQQLKDTEDGSHVTVLQKKSKYDEANKKVAILCNHQKGVSKAHDSQMEKLVTKKGELEDDLKKKQAEFKENKTDANAKKVHAVKERLDKLKLQMHLKEELKTVSLGTSKINYLDPRITVAWCKKHEVPINTIFTKALIEKFNWAMEVEPDFDF
mmetsp:Transcript_33564/g.40569  ORF Transcript_33564/g.40569 Transcript_33564/m.40569 type:complete len:661 (+) Transcript_33564:194-2176(+)|eukprot:CAMPEP_0197868434 /NCGR_PEP_ID=MMETSP1438-20131217/45284_1 /TAXON_ID=1461541 /ORGANISM="Pterosperma sp., Strain CCMP1384" /LENGTH=660 /DNA_ID=CAMNT_0043487141 /DNA_START=194 /DNA_END=2176 /DNA_ORIENTATION=+